jgi:hypothetical protein
MVTARPAAVGALLTWQRFGTITRQLSKREQSWLLLLADQADKFSPLCSSAVPRAREGQMASAAKPSGFPIVHHGPQF